MKVLYKSLDRSLEIVEFFSMIFLRGFDNDSSSGPGSISFSDLIQLSFIFSFVRILSFTLYFLYHLVWLLMKYNLILISILFPIFFLHSPFKLGFMRNRISISYSFKYLHLLFSTEIVFPILYRTCVSYSLQNLYFLFSTYLYFLFSIEFVFPILYRTCISYSLKYLYFLFSTEPLFPIFCAPSAR